MSRKAASATCVLEMIVPLFTCFLIVALSLCVVTLLWVKLRKAELVLSENEARAGRLNCLGDLAGGLAHELNQPLSGIRGYAENLLISKKRGWPVGDEELVKKLTEIVGLTERMAGLIDHVCRFSNETETIGLVPIDTREVVESALMMVSARFRGRGVDLDFHNEADDTMIEANPLSLEEAILTLLRNASNVLEKEKEAAADTLRAVTVRLLNEGSVTAPSKRNVTVEITNTSGPVPAETGRRTGQRIDRVRRIVESFGGHLELESDAGGGRVVRLRIPALDTAKRESA